MCLCMALLKSGFNLRVGMCVPLPLSPQAPVKDENQWANAAASLASLICNFSSLESSTSIQLVACGATFPLFDFSLYLSLKVSRGL